MHKELPGQTLAFGWLTHAHHLDGHDAPVMLVQSVTSAGDAAAGVFQLRSSFFLCWGVGHALHVAQGFVYVMDCEGRSLVGWPLQMGEVQAQPAVGDINGDGVLEVVAVDSRGNVAALSPAGTELWERHLKSSITQARAPGSHASVTASELVDVMRCAYLAGHRDLHKTVA